MPIMMGVPIINMETGMGWGQCALARDDLYAFLNGCTNRAADQDLKS